MRLRTFLSKISETRDWSEQEIQHRASDYEANSYVGKTEDFNWSFVSDFPVSTFLKAGMVDHSKKKHWIDFIEDEMTKNGTQDKNEYLRQYLKATEIHPIVVALAPDGRWDLWDGWHRVGASIATGTNTVLAIVGTPKANIIEQTLTEGQVSSQAAAKAIAADDELFDAVVGYVGWPDYFTETDHGRQQLPRFLEVLRRVRPFKKRLYRGEPAFEYHDWQPYSDFYEERGFTSWSLNTTTAGYFADGRDHIVKYTDGPMQAVSLEDIVLWRNRLRPNESHYSGMQAEYFVLEPVRRGPAFELREADENTQMPRVLYHGTSSEFTPLIKQQGMPAGSFWSPDQQMAWYFAEYAEMNSEGRGVILQLPFSDFDQSAFKVDNAMWHEPVDPLAEFWGIEDELASEWDNWIYGKWATTDKTWKDSLMTLRSVIYDKPIPPELFSESIKEDNHELRESKNDAAVEYYQWMRNKEGGQERGNQTIVTPITEPIYKRYVVPHLRKPYGPDDFAEYSRDFPHVTHVEIVKRHDANEPFLGEVGSIEQARPHPDLLKKGWVIKVDSFDSNEAKQQALTADSERSVNEAAESNFIKVYHATPRGNVVNIKNQTLNYPFVAEHPESAYQWGRHYADMEGQGICVLEFMVDSNRLLPDLNQDTYMEIWEKLGVPPDDREDIRTGDEGTYEWLLDEIHEHNIPYDAVQDMHGGFAAVYVGYINPTQVTDWDCYSADEESVPVPRIPGEPPAEGEEPNEMDAYYQKYGVPNTNQLRLFNGQSSPVKKVQEEQVAYHGSGANFAQFATEFMGSGEGGQMRGWGLYFAQEPEVAKHYQQMMVSSHKQGVLYTVELPDSDELLDMDIPWSQQSDKVKKIIEPYVPNPHDPERVVPTPDGYWTWVDFKGEPLYNPENKHGPNWKWNSKEEAYAKGRRIFAPRDSMTGLQIYFQLAHELGSEKAASLKLKEIGIPGVQFLDQFSREGKVIKKTYNFVMYDTSRIKIVDKQAINENRLKEIHLSGGEHDEGEEALRQIAQDNEGKLFKVGAFGSYTVLSPDRPWSDTDIVLIIEYLNRYVGILGLYNEDGKLFGVNRLWLDNDVRGQDVALGLYEWVLSQGVSLFSDNSHTPGSKKLWKDLGSRHQLYLFDRMARKAKKITTPEEFERAYQDHNYVLLVKATTNESVVKEAIQGLNLSSVEAFIDSLKRVPKERVQELQRIWDNLKAEATGGLTELYHGAPDKHAQKIRGQGFELTKGRRSGFMGAEHTVDNQGIFLTDSKPMAHYFGSNRSEFERDYEILTAYVDTSKVLDAGANPPRDLVRLGIKLLYDWDGIKRSRIPIREWWWLLDMPEFVDAIKEKGFTGVKFREDRVVRRAAQDEGNTYIIFDPKTIKTKGQQTMATTSAFYQWLVANQENEIIAEAIPVAPRRFVGFTKKRIEDLQFIEKRLLRISDKVEQLKKGGETFEDTMADASSAMRDLDIYPDDVLQWGDKVYGGTELRAARALNTEGLKGNLELVLMTDREQDPDMRIMASALDRYINYVKGIENLDELNKLVAHREDIENGFREYRILDPEYPEIEQTAQSFLSIIDDLKSIQEPLKRVINAAQQYQVILDKRASFFRGESQHVPQTEDVETLWHATAYAAEIARNGFQLGTHHGRQGLGSYGRSNGISFTHDLQIAREISRSLKELTMIANGQLTRRHILGWMQSEGIDFNKARQIHGEQVLTSDDPKWVAVLYNIWISYTGLRQNPVFANIQNTVTQLKGRNPNDVGIIQSDINMKADGIEHKTAESEWVVPTNAVLSVKRIQ